MVTNIDCQVRAYSKHNLEQPRLVFKGLCNTIVIDENNYATITWMENNKYVLIQEGTHKVLGIYDTLERAIKLQKMVLELSGFLTTIQSAPYKQ